MTPIQMAQAAAQAVANEGCTGVVLTMRKGGTPKGFPRGELLNEMRRDGVVERTCSFDPQKVLAWLIKNDLVTMERISDRVLMYRAVDQ